MTATIANNRKSWTPADDRKLMDLYKQCKSYGNIANELRRTEDAVKARFVKIHICLIYNKNDLLNKKNLIAQSFNIKEEDFARYLKYNGISVLANDQDVVNYLKRIDSKLNTLLARSLSRQMRPDL